MKAYTKWYVDGQWLHIRFGYIGTKNDFTKLLNQFKAEVHQKPLWDRATKTLKVPLDRMQKLAKFVDIHFGDDCLIHKSQVDYPKQLKFDWDEDYG